MNDEMLVIYRCLLGFALSSDKITIICEASIRKLEDSIGSLSLVLAPKSCKLNFLKGASPRSGIIELLTVRPIVGSHFERLLEVTVKYRTIFEAAKRVKIKTFKSGFVFEALMGSCMWEVWCCDEAERTQTLWNSGRSSRDSVLVSAHIPRQEFSERSFCSEVVR